MMPRRAADGEGRDHRRRARQQQGARADDDEDGDRLDRRVVGAPVEEPDQGRDREGDGHEEPADLLDEQLARALAALRGADELADLADRGVAADAGDLEVDHARQVGRAREDLGADSASMGIASPVSEAWLIVE
jgi:hypothetical protein